MKKVVAVFCLVLLVQGTLWAQTKTDATEDRFKALEERIKALEAEVEALRAPQAAPAGPLSTAPEAAAPGTAPPVGAQASVIPQAEAQTPPAAPPTGQQIGRASCRKECRL